MSALDIIIIIALIWAARYALRNVVRAVLVVATCAVLLSLGCVMVSRHFPQFVDGSSRLFGIFSRVGDFLLGLF